MSVASSTRLSASSDLSPQSAVNDSFTSNGETSGVSSEQSGNDSSGDDGDDSAGPPSKRFKQSPSNATEDGLSDSTLVDYAEHQGQRYFVGDHVVLEDAENTSGTMGTNLPAVGHIQQLERDAQMRQVRVSVVWYVYPQLTPHPPLMEFYKNTLLRTTRQTTVPLEHVKRTCFVVQPAEAMVGHPIEFSEDASGLPLFVCDSRFNDKGGFIQRIKHRARGYWPAAMDQKRQDMLTNMVPWSGGPRELEKSLVPVQAANDDHTNMTPQTRRTLRLTSTSIDLSSPARVPTQPGITSSVAAMSIGLGSPTTSQQQLPSQTLTMPTNQSQYLAYQQMLVQSQIQPLAAASAINGQPPPPPFLLNGASLNSATSSNGSVRAPGIPASPTPPLPLLPTPKRRGRPPKNKQLIEQRAMEDAAKMAELVAQGYTPGTQLRSSTRHQNAAIMPNGVRPPVPLTLPGQAGSTPQRIGQSGMAAMHGGANLSPAQLLAARVQPAAAPVATSQMLQQQQKLAQHQSQVQQKQQQQQQLMQKQQQQQLLPLAHTDPALVPQLPKDVVELFPTADGKLKWFATLPVCRATTDTSVIRHSAAYTKWKQSQGKSCAGDSASK